VGSIPTTQIVEQDDTIEVIDYHALWLEFLNNRKQLVARVSSGVETSLLINVDELNTTLFESLVYRYADCVSYVRSALKELGCNPESVRFVNFPRKVPIRDIRSDKIGKFLSFTGIARSVSTVKPLITVAVFECSSCRQRKTIEQSSLLTDFPDTCSCKHGKWNLLPDKCKMVDYQSIRVQERPDELRGGEVPADVSVYVTGDLCGKVTAGNRLIVNGVLKPLHTKRGSLVIDTVFEGNMIELNDQDFDEIKIDENDEKLIREVAKRDDYLDVFIRSIAPSIYGYTDIKKAVLLQLFGGVRHRNRDGTFKRGDTHILILGDPGVAKSQLLEGVFQLCPRGVRASGKGSSRAGLTAAAVQDPSGGWTIEAGAIVLSDKGHLIVDEIDKMREEDRSALHEGMEQQKISIAKAGINTTLMARCSILAAANPTTGRFDATLDIAEQIDMPPTLLSRFDLIFLMKDQPDEEKDGNIADFILSNHDGDIDSLSPEFMRKYISFAKQINPSLSAAAKTVLKSYYLSIRKLAKQHKAIPITARQLDALRRLSESAARMRLSDTVDSKDAEMVVEIVDSCLKHVAYDPVTKQFDIDKITTKMSTMKRDLFRDLEEMITTCSNESGVARISVVVDKMEEQGWDRLKTQQYIDELSRTGRYYFPPIKDSIKKS